MNSNPPLFLVVKFKNVNKKSKTITAKKNMMESHYCNLTTRKTQRILKERGPLRNLCGDTTILKTSKQQNIVKSYAKKAKNEYLFKKKKSILYFKETY